MPSGKLGDELKEETMGSGADLTRKELEDEAKVAMATDEQKEYYVDEPSGDVRAIRGGFTIPEANPSFWDANNIDEVAGGSTPSQYGLPEGATDLQDLIEFRDMNFAIGNIFKACYRMHNCNHSITIRDVNKILWFANRELERLSDG